jgi:hypothetical protein
MSDELTIIGWRERVTFPDWHIRGLKAKIDTGAKTSALHVEDLEDDGRTARFHVALSRDGSRLSRLIETPIVRRTTVRSSTGHQENRIVVATRVRIAGVDHAAEFTLVRRHQMRYRMLVGRRLIEGYYLVDVSRDPLKKRARPAPSTKDPQ